MSLFTSLCFASMFRGFGAWRLSRAMNPSMNYLTTCYCDLDQPTGLSSLVDGGRSINWPYRSLSLNRSSIFCGGFFGSSCCNLGMIF